MARITPISEDKLLSWRERLRSAEEVIEKRHLPIWRKVLQDYSGELGDDEGIPGVSLDSFDRVNYLLATSNAVLPTIIGQSPSIRVRPRRPEDADSAKVAQYALNWAWHTIKATDTTRQIALDTLLFGVGVGKVGFDPSGSYWSADDYDTGPDIPSPDDVEDPDLDERVLRDVLAEQGIFTDEPQDKPTLTRVCPWNLLLPTGYYRLEDCPWVAERLVVRLEDLRADKRFRVPKEVTADAYLETEVPKDLMNPDSDNIHVDPGFEPEYVIVYEIRYWKRLRDGSMKRYVLWLLRGGQMPEVKDAVLRHIPDPLEMRGYPYESLHFVRSPQDFHSTKISDLASIQGLSDSLNDMWENMLELHQLNGQLRGKFLVAAGSLEDGRLSQLLNSGVRGAVQEVNVGMRVQDAVMPLPEAHQPSDTPMVMTALSRLMHEISGVDVYQRGGVGRKGTTATEVATANAGFQSRITIRLNAIESFIEGASGKMLSLMRQFWDEARWIRVVGDRGEDDFVRFSSGDIQGVYDVEIEAGSTVPTDPAEEQVAHMGLLQAIQQTVGVLAPMIQQGLLPADAMANFIDRAFTIYQQDRRSLVGPLASLQQATQSAMTPPAPSGAPADAVSAGNGMDPNNGASLAGTGPRPGAGGMPSGLPF
tara:strand:+ start:7280 stop:9223 length:1944 start_codon:yes stop_codon:yes gene_type:complete